MDPRLLDYYERELQFIREMGREFAKAYPKIGSRLDLDSFECADPYVERLLEGFAFLTARIQLKLDAEFPCFTQHLLELIYPNYLAPVPSMAVVQFTPDLDGGIPPEGFVLERDTRLYAPATDRQHTRVQLQTGNPVELRPLLLAKAEYLIPGSLAPHIRRITENTDGKAALRLNLQTAMDFPLSAMKGLDQLEFFLAGSGRIPWQMYEWIHAHTLAVVVETGPDNTRRLNRDSILQPGFSPEESLLPVDGRNFQGYRMLQEYFAFPLRYRFFGIQGLAPVIENSNAKSFTLTFLFDSENPKFEGIVSSEHFALHCAPVVNLFPKRCDRIHLDPGRQEYHIVVDRTRPLSYEVHSILTVEGYSEGAKPVCEFMPFYQQAHRTNHDGAAYYTVQRRPYVKSQQSEYLAHELYLSLVTENDAPFPPDLKQLGLQALCTNRDLCRRISLGGRLTDFHLDTGAPVTEVRAIAGPSVPCATYHEGEYAWRLISHLSLNYQSLASTDTLRELLALYASIADPSIQRQIEGLTKVTNHSIISRLPGKGPITFGRGTEVQLEFDDKAFEGGTPYLLAVILSRFLTSYTSINSFVQTKMLRPAKGEPVDLNTEKGNRIRV